MGTFYWWNEKLPTAIVTIMKSISKHALFICLISGTSYAHEPTNTMTIRGNPLAGQSNYTINSSKAIQVKVQCDFQNKSQVPAQLALWTDPGAKKPAQVITLKPMRDKPTTTKLKFKFDLKPHWWCLIHVPENQKENKYCQYFSIADNTISRYHGFKTWNKTTKAKKASYTCQLKPSTPRSYFFYLSELATSS